MLGMILKTPFGKFIRRISIERIRRLTMFTLVILSAGLIFVTTAMHMQASSDSFGQLPFNLHSYLRADYSVDSFPNRLAAVNFDLVLDYLNDKFYGDAPERFGTAIGGLESPVPTVTPSYPWGFTQTLSPTTTLYPSETSSRTPFPPRTSTATPSKPPSHYLTLTPTWKPTSTPTLRPTVKPTETPKPTKPEPTETPPTKQPPTKPPPTDPYPPPPPPPPPPPYP